MGHSSMECCMYPFYDGQPCTICMLMHATENHRQISTSNQRRVERLVFCWWCKIYQPPIHFCEVKNQWRHVDVFNFMVIAGPSRESVERCRNYSVVDCDITLYVSRVRMNKEERDAAEQYQERKKVEAQQKQDKLEAELCWKGNRAILERWIML